MSKYYILDGQLYDSSELSHKLRGPSPLRGIARDNHKYVKREWRNGRWRYTYPDTLAKNTDVVPIAKNDSNNVTQKKVAGNNSVIAVEIGKKFVSALADAKNKFMDRLVVELQAELMYADVNGDSNKVNELKRKIKLLTSRK